MSAQQDFNLKPPRAGLPFFDWLVARYYIFPFHICRKTREEAIEICVSAGEDCLKLVDEIGEEEASQPVLIRPLKGLEDSSRLWSAAMVIEHLIIVHNGMLKAMTALSNHKTLDVVVGTADVKPTGAMSVEEAVTTYRKLLDEYPEKIADMRDMDNKQYKHKHPWFGPMTAHQWLCVNAQHTKIHRQQLKEIKKGLG